MGHHLLPDGTFKSDRYEWCPPGFFALKFTDPLARSVIRDYAWSIKFTDPELSVDLYKAADQAALKELSRSVLVGEG